MRNMPFFTCNQARVIGRNFKSIHVLLILLAAGVLFSAPVVAQDIIDPHLCAGDYNASLGCSSNDIQINDVTQMTELEGGDPPIATCLEGDLVTLDIKLTTMLNAQTRYDAVVWFGKEGNNPRAVGGGSCYASSFPDNPLSPYIGSAPADDDSCLDVYESKPTPVEQYFFDIEVECLDLVSPTPDPNDDLDAVVSTPDGQLDVFALVSWGNNVGSIDCGLPGDEPITDPPTVWNLEPGGPSKCDAALLLGIDVEVLEHATIQVVKNSSGGEGAFDFTTDIPGLSPGFTLDTTGDGTEATAVIQLDDTEVGVTYSITETVPAGWSLASATCSNGDTPDAVTPLDEQEVVCTFNDVKLGSVSVVKETIGADGSFDFVTDLPGGNFSRTTTGGVSPAYVVSDVPVGVYSVVETVPAGWDLTSATCTDGSNPATLDVAAGETVTCTFVNTARGTIIVEKQTLPDGSPVTFDFTGDAAGTIGDGGQIVVSGLVPGTYTSTETVPAGWDLTGMSCDDLESPVVSSVDIPTATATFNLDAGETVKCTFFNTQRGSIEVVKSLSATGPAVETFGFTSSFYGTFDLTGHGDTTGAIAVTPGSGYTVSEDDPTTDGWANVSATCTGGDDPTSDIDVSPGEAVVCTFTNTPLGSATIIKNTVGGDDTFDFVGDPPFNGLQLTTVAGTASEDFTYELLAGAYDVTEDPVPAGWALTNVGCTEDGDQDSSAANPTATLDVELAETVTCTFTNTADGTLIIRKEVIPNVEQGFEFTGDAAGTIFDYVGSGGDQLSVSGQPGIYSSAEVVPPGWALTDISCTGQSESTVYIGVGTSGFEDGDTNVNVTLAAGETVICTFENTAQGSITIEKETLGDVGSFTFNRSGDFSGSFPIDTTGVNPEGIAFTTLLPGSYMISEVVPSNWTLTDITCSGETGSTITIGGAGGFDPGDVGVTIDLLDGEDITCRFTNAAHGSITVAKETFPEASQQGFDFTGDITATLADGQSSTVFVPAGSYSASETGLLGWDLSDILCDDDNSSGDTITGVASFIVGHGEDISCTFTNTQQGNISIVKNTVGGDGTFNFTSTTLGGFGILTSGNTGQADFTNLSASSHLETGPYDVAETVPAGWDLDTAVCDDGSEPGDIDLAPGETVICTFTNVQQGNISIVKNTVGGDGIFDFVSIALGDFPITTSGNTGQADYTNLSASSYQGTGSYDVAETVPAGWDLGTAVCDDASDPGAIDLAAGETVTCTFTNIQRGSVTIAKQTDTNGTFWFGFSGPAYGAVLISIETTNFTGQHSFLDLRPGSYSVTELDPTPLILVSATCNNGDDPASLILDAGENIICTFVNANPVPVPANSTWALLLLTLMMLATGWYFRPAAMRKF